MRNHKRLISLILTFALMLALGIPAFAAIEDTGFSDVDAGAWYAEAVVYCREHSLMAGVGNHQFAPESSLTRAMLAAVLWRQAGSPAVDYLLQFTDVPEGQWYTEAIRWAASEGLVRGYGDGRFGTNDSITQQQLDIILNNYLGRTLTQDIPGFYGSTAVTTRAQVAAVLLRLAQTQQVPSELDDHFVLLPGGTFTMGSPDSERLREADETAHQVTVSSFYIDPYEVTQADYERIMGTNPSHFSGADLPVDSVTWYDAIEYCNKLSVNRGLTPAYTVNGETVTWNRAANGYRLLTEAEWEYAARGGTTTAFYTGEYLYADQANYNGTYPYLIEANYTSNTNPNVRQGPCCSTTVSVNTLSPNAFNLYHMLGNVSEWVFDCYGSYDLTNTINPAGSETGHLRINRGGDYNDFAKHLRCAYRSATNPLAADRNLGFRIARNAQPGAGSVHSTNDLNITTPAAPKILIVYFSEFGNTANAARILHQKTGADLVEIEMVRPYTDVYHQTVTDLYGGIRPELSTRITNMDEYDVILLGYPTWWSSIPMPVISFLESYDFSGKTIINFSSNGSGRFGESVSQLAKEAPGAYIGFGFEFSYSGGSSLSRNLSRWLEKNGIPEI